MTIQFGAYLNAIDISYEEIKRRWLTAENAGFDYIWTMDNVVGAVPHTPETPVMDTWTMLPALAEATSRVKFGTLVTPYGRRRPAVIAKSATILDHISNGRFNLGMGPGDEPWQHEPWGQDYPKASIRIAMLREELTIIKKMFTEEKATFQGEYYHVKDAINEPKPVHKPHPPIWIGLVFGKKLMPRLAADFADGINVYNGNDDDAVEMLNIVENLCKENGRDFNKIMTSRNVGMTLTEGPFDREQFLQDTAKNLGKSVQEAREYFDVYECHVAGRPEEVVEQLYNRTIKLGFRQPVINFAGGAGGLKLTYDKLSSDIDTFMTQIAPRVRELAGE